MAFKATSSKGKAKQDTSSEDDGSWDDEKMALFVKRFNKFMMKKGYRARRKKSSSKNKEESRRCFNMEAKIILLLNAHTIVTKMMTRRTRRTRRKRKRRRT